MCSLYNRKNIIILALISFLILFIQINLPSIFIFGENEINLDLILVYLTFLVFLVKDTYKVIILAFLYGLIQDIIINIEQLGLLSFIKSFTVFLISYVLKYETIWKWKIKLLYIFLIYSIHFSIYYIIIYREIYIAVLFAGFIQASVCIFIFALLNKLLFKIK